MKIYGLGYDGDLCQTILKGTATVEKDHGQEFYLIEIIEKKAGNYSSSFFPSELRPGESQRQAAVRELVEECGAEMIIEGTDITREFSKSLDDSDDLPDGVVPKTPRI